VDPPDGEKVGTRDIMGKDCATLPAANVAEKFYATRNKFIISTGHNKLFRGLFEIARAFPPVLCSFMCPSVPREFYFNYGSR